MKPIDLRSDTVTKPTPAMRAAMATAEVGDDVYGDDPTVNALQERIAAMLGFEAALFVPSGTMSTAEAISVLGSGLALAAHFGDGRLTAQDTAAALVGAVVKDPVQDKVVWNEYLETVVKTREDWRDIYRACREVFE